MVSTDGSDVSMSMPSTTAGADVLPARSVTVSDTDWFAPSSLSTAAAGQSPSAMPDVSSSQVKLTVTGVLCQPAVTLDASMVGAVAS